MKYISPSFFDLGHFQKRLKLFLPKWPLCTFEFHRPVFIGTAPYGISFCPGAQWQKRLPADLFHQ